MSHRQSGTRKCVLGLYVNHVMSYFAYLETVYLKRSIKWHSSVYDGKGPALLRLLPQTKTGRRVLLG